MTAAYLSGMWAAQNVAHMENGFCRAVLDRSNAYPHAVLFLWDWPQSTPKWNSQGRETEQRRKGSWEFFCGIKSASSRCWTHKAAEFFAPNIHTLKLSIWFFFCLWINFPQIFNNLFPPLSVSVRKLTIKNLSWEKFYNFRFNSNSKGHIQMPKYEVQHSECTSGKPRKSKRCRSSQTNSQPITLRSNGHVVPMLLLKLCQETKDSTYILDLLHKILAKHGDVR